MFTIVAREELDALNLSFGLPYIDAVGQPYFTKPAGTEHYRLLAHFSSLYTHRLILDVGTFHGASAVALSANPKVQVLSYDIQNHRTLDIQRPNMEFRVKNVLEDKDRLAQASLILLDTYHNGDFEREFMQCLKDIGYRGTVLLDDIFLNEAMKSFWGEISLPKANLTAVGHWSGTGAVYFSFG